MFGVILIGACGGGGGGSTPTPTVSGTPAPTGGGTINGLVTDASTGARLAGVAVTGGGQTATTDSHGAYTLGGFTGGTSVAVSFDKTGYALGHGNAEIGVNAAPLLLSLKKEGARTSYNAPASTAITISQATEAGPYAVIFTPGTLDTTDTALKVSVTPLDPTKESSVLPGNLATASVMLAPLTFAEFSVFDSTGARVNLLSGQTATVEMPIPPDLRARPEYQIDLVNPKIVHCYSYNPVTGQWEDFVVGTIVKSSVDGTTPVLRADIHHFSWYGGAPQSNDCIDVYGRVVSAVDGKPLPFARVEAFPGTVATSDANGNFVVVTTRTGENSFTASRTFIDTDGSVSGTPGAKVIEFGKVVDELIGLVTRPCGSVVTPPPIPTPPPTPSVIIKIGGIGLLSYQVNAFLTDTDVFASLYEANPDGSQGAPVSGAIMVLSGPGGPVTLTEPGTGVYLASLSTTPGGRYTLTIDADHNGSIDGTGSVNAVGSIAWTTPTNGATLSAAGFNNAQWSDSGAAVTGYSVVYFANISNTSGTTAAIASYTGSDLHFNPVNLLSNPANQALPAGPYSALLFGFSGPYQPGGTNWTPTNNITGATVSGKFYSFGIAPSINFTLQ